MKPRTWLEIGLALCLVSSCQAGSSREGGGAPPKASPGIRGDSVRPPDSVSSPDTSRQPGGGATAFEEAPPPEKAAARPAAAKPDYTLEAVTIEIRHRVFRDFVDEHRVKLGEEFVIGDTDYTGELVDFVPDFAMKMESREVISRTSEPNNPAFQIIVRKADVPEDTTWALLKMPPHFSRRALLAFKILRVDFDGREALVAPDEPVAPGKGAQP